MRQKQTANTKRPAAQAEPSKRAAAKRPQPLWLRQPPPVLVSDPAPVPERVNQSPRLLDKSQVCAIANVSFPTVWAWMRAGTFPRSRICGGKSMWLSSEVEAWIASLPLRPLKGDPLEAAE